MTQYCLSVLPAIDRILQQSRRILIASDFDGTLCPIANSPSEVRVTPHILEILRILSASTRIKLAVISGRALDDVATRLPIGATFSGNHGLEIRGSGLQFEHPSVRDMLPELKRVCDDLVEVLQPWPGAWMEDKRLTATLHYRHVPVAHHHALRGAVRRRVVGRTPSIGLRSARRALELYPKLGWGKGDALSYIEDKCGPFDLCICLGDDRTDESMFHQHPTRINVKVGLSRPTKAQFHLSDPSDVAIFLERVMLICESSTLRQESSLLTEASARS